MNSSKSPPSLWEGQWLHFLSLSLLVLLVWLIWDWQGKPFPVKFWACIFVPILHQVFVWLSWRLELLSAYTSRSIGFQLYLKIFFILFAGRFVTVFCLAYVDRGSLSLSVYPRVTITAVALVLGVYALYSVKRYFGMARAAGADHFDKSYRGKPFVKDGIFRFTTNAMYLYAFLLFWAIAIGFNSSAAIVAVAFCHLYIWVLFYSTEKPDMEYIYESRA